MVEWHDYLTNLLSESTIFDGLTMSLYDPNQSISIPPIIKASNLLLDKMIENQGKANVIVFPERIESIFTFTLVRLLYNISIGRIESNYNPNCFTPNDNLRIGKAVVKFKGIKTDSSGKIRMSIETSDLIDSAPIDFFPFFQKTNAKRINNYQTFCYEKKKAEANLSKLSTNQKLLQILADHKTHMDSSIVNMTTIANAKSLISKCRLCEQNINDIIFFGQTDFEGNVHNIGTGQLKGIPAIVLASDLYAIASMAEKGSPIQSIIIDGSNASLLESQKDSLDKLLKMNIPITCVTDIVNSFDLFFLLDRGFNIWRWDETNIIQQLYNSAPIETNLKVKNCSQRTIQYSYLDDKLINNTIELLNSNKNDTITSSPQMIKLFDKLFSLSFYALWETIPYSNELLNRNKSTLSDCRIILENEKRFISDKTYSDYKSVIDNLSQTFCSSSINQKHKNLVSYLSSTNSKKIILVIPDQFDKTIVKEYWINWCDSNNKSLNIEVCYPSDYYHIPCDSYDTTIVAGWFKRAVMRKILFSYNTKNYVVLLYAIEKKWKDFSTTKWEELLCDSNNIETIEKSFSTEHSIISTKGMIRSKSPGLSTSQKDEFDEIELILRENKYRQYVSGTDKKDISNSVEAIPVNFIGGSISFYRTGHQVITASDIILNDEESIKMKSPQDLNIGDFVVVRKTDQDLIKDIADIMLSNSGKSHLREIAGKWKEALQIESLFSTPEQLFERLRQEGCTKGFQTVKSWLLDDDMISPQSKQDLLLIAKATNSSVLEEMLDEVYDAASLVKNAHIQAGRFLSMQLRNKIVDTLKSYGDIDPFNIWEPIEIQVDDIGLVKILKIIDIGSQVFVNRSDTNRLIEE